MTSEQKYSYIDNPSTLQTDPEKESNTKTLQRSFSQAENTFGLWIQLRDRSSDGWLLFMRMQTLKLYILLGWKFNGSFCAFNLCQLWQVIHLEKVMKRNYYLNTTAADIHLWINPYFCTHIFKLYLRTTKIQQSCTKKSYTSSFPIDLMSGSCRTLPFGEKQIPWGREVS